MSTWQIAGGELEFVEDTHQYVFDGIILPSVTQILSTKFGNKYDRVDAEVLQRAREKGNAVHEAIERYEKYGENSELPELTGYKKLKDKHHFKCLGNEIPVVLFLNGIPSVAGRLDLVLDEGGDIGLGDIKRTYRLDREYLQYQLNLYRIAYQQCYNTHISFLRALHLRERTKSYIDIPIEEEMALQLVYEHLKGGENNDL